MQQKYTRTYLIYQLPAGVNEIKGESNNKGYIIKDKNHELSLCNKGEKYTLKLKKKDISKPDTMETVISPEQFSHLWPATKGRQIKKTRRFITIDKVNIKIDSFEGRLKGLILAYADFSSPVQAAQFRKPEYFKEELTFDKRFREPALSCLTGGDLKKILPMKKPGHYKLIGVIPYRKYLGKTELVMVTTRSKGSWIFPKGQPMLFKSSEEVAQQEALEEAGIRGITNKNSLLVPFIRNKKSITLQLFPMEVTQVEKHWEEEGERKRKILSPGKAKELTKQDGLKSAMEWLNFLMTENL